MSLAPSLVIDTRPVLTCARERLAHCRAEFEAELCKPHWEEVGYHNPAAPLAINWPLYEACDRNGSFLILVLRDRDVMVGYWCGFVASLPHYTTTKHATADAYYILPAYRTRGALRLFRTLHRECRALGVVRIFNRAKPVNNAGPLFEALGYEKTEITYGLTL